MNTKKFSGPQQVSRLGRSLALLSLALLLIVLAAACNKAPSDAQVASDVQNKIYSDAAVQSRQITVNAANGVVTLAGTVNSDAERAAAANDAAAVQGVKTVVNNLETAPAQAQNVAPEPPQATPPPAPEPKKQIRREPRKAPAYRSKTAVAPEPAPAPSTSAREMPSPTYDMQPSTPPKPVTLTIPEGTTLSARLVDALSSQSNHAGDTFRATLDSPVYVNGAVAIPSGADLAGRVVEAKDAAHFSGSSSLSLELVSLDFNGHNYPIRTNQFSRQGTARGKNTAEKVGGGAALGAILGGIFGGGKGAAIGAGVGAAAGTGAQAATKGQQIKLTSEQLLNFQLQNAVTVTPASRTNRNANRQRLEMNQ